MKGQKKKTQTDKAQRLQISPVWLLAQSTYNYSAVIFIYLFSAPTRQEREKEREWESSHNSAPMVRQQARNWKSYSNG